MIEERIVHRVIGLAQKLTQFANWLERNNRTLYWNPWVIGRKYSQ